MKLSRLSNRQLRNLLRKGEVRFAETDRLDEIFESSKKDLLAKYERQWTAAMDILNKLEKITGLMYNIDPARRNPRFTANVKSAYARLEQARNLVISTIRELRKD